MATLTQTKYDLFCLSRTRQYNPKIILFKTFGLGRLLCMDTEDIFYLLYFLFFTADSTSGWASGLLPGRWVTRPWWTWAGGGSPVLMASSRNLVSRGWNPSRGALTPLVSADILLNHHCENNISGQAWASGPSQWRPCTGDQPQEQLSSCSVYVNYPCDPISGADVSWWPLDGDADYKQTSLEPTPHTNTRNLTFI